jgi:hypothetical protein
VENEHGRNRHRQRLAALKLWAHPLQLSAGAATYHVRESADPAGAILDCVRNNLVDHVVIGTRGTSSLRRHLGSGAGAGAVHGHGCKNRMLGFADPGGGELAGATRSEHS